MAFNPLKAYKDAAVAVGTGLPGAIARSKRNAGKDPITGLQTGGSKNRSKNRFKPVKMSKEMLARDVEALQNDPSQFGLSASDKEKMVSEAQQAATAQRQGQQAELARTALAGQGFQAGAFQQAQQDIAAGASQTAAEASAKANEMDRQMIEREASRIRGELDAARERARQNAHFWADFGMRGAEAGAQVATAAIMGGEGEA